MDWLEAIAVRRSRRSYLDTPLRAEDAAALQAAIETENEASGLTMTLVMDGAEAFNGFSTSYGMFAGVRAFIAVKGPKDDPNLLEKAGYHGERIVLQATALGLGSCWVGGVSGRRKLVTLTPEEAFVCLIVVGNVSDARTVKERLIYRAAHGRTKPYLERSYTDVKALPDWFVAGMHAVERAPSAMNAQRPIFAYIGEVVTAGVRMHRDSDLIDLGIAKLHFELAGGGAFSLGNPGTLTREAQPSSEG